jgi:uncharacterized protein (DUF2164 family)
MSVEIVKINQVKVNPNNPRLIKDDKFKKLLQSIKDFPEMLNIRPIVVNQDMIILGGNMRYKACKEAGLKEIPIIITDLTEDQQREFTIKDNTSGGEWDWEVLANEWDVEQLEDWGLDIPADWIEDEVLEAVDEQDLFDIEIPFYTPSEVEPQIFELADTEKTKALVSKIEELKVPNELKEILKLRASFFTDFNFDKIADYFYNQQNEDVKNVMKSLGMVIIAPKESLNLGFAQMHQEIFDL